MQDELERWVEEGVTPVVVCRQLGGRGAVASRSLNDVYLERLAQLDEFSSGVDDLLEPSEWIARVAKHLGRAVTHDPDVFRQELVVVGALALAAVESFDRKFGAAG